MASVYIGLAQNSEVGDGVIASISTVAREMNASAVKMSNLLMESGIADNLRARSLKSKMTVVDDLISLREYRGELFQKDLFFDPAWNILVDLYRCHLTGKRAVVGDVCAGSGAPPTTALRWIRILEHRGLLKRKPDSTDGRRLFVELSDVSIEKMERLAEAAIKQSYGSN